MLAWSSYDTCQRLQHWCFLRLRRSGSNIATLIDSGVAEHACRELDLGVCASICCRLTLHSSL